MNIKLICIGKIKEASLLKLIEEYEKRLSRFCNFRAVVLNDLPIPEKASSGELIKIKEKEGEAILKQIDKGDIVFSMCIEGKKLSSEEFAKKISDSFMQSSSLVFIIGGSLGLSDEIKRISNVKLSMSDMTFPHNIARLMITEQIYRAFKINANETYHK